MQKNSFNKTLWISVLGTIAFVVLGMVLLVKYGSGTPTYLPGINELTADDNIYGPADAKVRLLEYADFQCPACVVYNNVIKELKKEYGDRVAFVYRHFPIPGHTNGVPAAQAAESAGRQGKFFEMADLLYDHQSEWSVQNSNTLGKTFDSYAQTLGLDMDKFRADYKSDVVRSEIDKDADGGIKAGINATPTFFVNGKKIQPKDYDEFKRELDSALAQ